MPNEPTSLEDLSVMESLQSDDVIRAAPDNGVSDKILGDAPDIVVSVPKSETPEYRFAVQAMNSRKDGTKHPAKIVMANDESAAILIYSRYLAKYLRVNKPGLKYLAVCQESGKRLANSRQTKKKRMVADGHDPKSDRIKKTLELMAV